MDHNAATTSYRRLAAAARKGRECNNREADNGEAMSTTTLNYTGKLVTTNCWCGVWHAVPKELYDHMLAQHNNGERQTGIYCPLGHSWTFGGKGEAQRLREEKERLERVAASRAESLRIVREERDRAEKSAHLRHWLVAGCRARRAVIFAREGCGRLERIGRRECGSNDH